MLFPALSGQGGANIVRSRNEIPYFVAMSELVVDIGNTLTKLALFHAGQIQRVERLSTLTKDAVIAFLDGITPEKIGVASVGNTTFNEGQSPQEVLGSWAKVQEITALSPAPIRTEYASKNTLGVDRFANAVAAYMQSESHAVLAIDTGTCMTYDLVLNGVHQGGAITPGVRLRALAMHEHSARLPLVQVTEVPSFLGTDTVGSLESGAFHGLIAEIEGMVAQYRTEHPNLYVVITGGDALTFQKVMKSTIFADPFLTLKGIHAILCYA